MNEDQLWKTFTSGNDSKFRTLFDLFYPVLCLYAKQFIDNKEINEDIVQNVFVSLWEKRNKLLIGTSIRNYLLISVRNQCFDYLRRLEYMHQYTDYQLFQHAQDSASSDEVYLLSELQEQLEQALEKLPEIYRIVFEMRHLEGKDYAEIAEALKISTRTARRYNSATTDLLKNKFKDYLPLILALYSLCKMPTTSTLLQ